MSSRIVYQIGHCTIVGFDGRPRRKGTVVSQESLRYSDEEWATALRESFIVPVAVDAPDRPAAPTQADTRAARELGQAGPISGGQIDPSQRAAVQPLQGQSDAPAPKEPIVAKRKWLRDPAQLEDLDLEQLYIAIHEIDPEVDLGALDEAAARALLSSDFVPVFQEPLAPPAKGAPLDDAAREARATRSPAR